MEFVLNSKDVGQALDRRWNQLNVSFLSTFSIEREVLLEIVFAGDCILKVLLSQTCGLLS